MIPRLIHEAVQRALQHQAAVAILGPRQSGKTTLALELGTEINSLYLDLENRGDLSRLAEPALFLESVSDRLVILDEIHRVPDLFQTLRGLIDQGRRAGNRTGRFLLLGSASIDLLRQGSESLAGRISFQDLTPFTANEIDDEHAARERLWLRGGFPLSFLADSDEISFNWRNDFIRTYLERDIAMFGPRVPATTLERLWTMLAHRQGSTLNSSELARALEVSPQSVIRYVDLLADLLLVRRLPPLFANVRKRLVKSPKVYIRDSGIVHALLGITTLTALAGHPVIGMSWEGFVIETLLTSLSGRAHGAFYRTSGGAEIDLVIELADGDRWAVEIKRSRNVRVSRGFHTACDDIRPARSFVVYAGDERFPVAPRVEAIGVRQLALELRNRCT